MAYSTSNPPSLLLGTLGDGVRVWIYSSTDAIADVDATDYITNASDLGMQTNDFVFIEDTTNNLCSLGKATVDADGNATLTALTAFP